MNKGDIVKDVDLVPFKTLIDPKDYWNLSIILIFVGFFSLLYFIIYQITYKKEERSLTKEIVTSVFSSIFLSSGAFFLFLGLGLYL